MGQVLKDTVSDPNSDKRFRLVADVVEALPIPLPQGAGQPPGQPPIAPPLASEPEPAPEKPNILELRIKELEQDNDQLVCVLYHLQQELKDLRGSK
jgi:hypothetical protein